MKLINRRSEARFQTDGIAEMRIARPGHRESFKARVCDVSKSGLRIHINRRVLEGSEVVIQLGEILVSAEARRCSEIGSDLYEVGLKIIDVQAMSKPTPPPAWQLGGGFLPHVGTRTAASGAEAN